MRADAAANRERILAAATTAFERDGLDVALDDIARQAGVGPGTVHRHFPTKAALIDATIAESVEALAREANALRKAADPVDAFTGFFVTMIERGAASHALAHRLAGAGTDIDAAVAEPVRRLRAALHALLRRARRAGGVRRDLDHDALDALVAGAHAIQVHPHGGLRVVRMLCDAIRTQPS